MEENPKKEKHEKELGLVVSQQTVIRNPAELSLLDRTKKRGNSENEKKRKRIWPRRVPTDRDSESGRTQSPLQGKKRGNSEKENNGKELGLVESQQTVIRNPAELSLLERSKKRGNLEKEKNKKEPGRMDRKFGISRSNSPHPQIFGSSLGP